MRALGASAGWRSLATAMAARAPKSPSRDHDHGRLTSTFDCLCMHACPCVRVQVRVQGVHQVLAGARQDGRCHRQPCRRRGCRAARHAPEAHRRSLARQLSYEACEFELVENVGDERVRRLYNKGEQIQASTIWFPISMFVSTQHQIFSLASELWTDLQLQLVAKSKQLDQREAMEEQMLEITGGELSEEMAGFIDLHRDSDSEDEDDDEGERRRKRRKGSSKNLQGLFWSAHQRE